MQANFDARTGAAGGLTAPIERKQPEARKDRWMLELERAALAEQAANRVPSGASTRQAPVGGPATAAGAGVAGHHAGAGAAPAHLDTRTAQDTGPGHGTRVQQDSAARHDAQDTGPGHDTRAQQDSAARHDVPDKAARRAGGTHVAAGLAQHAVAGAHWTSAAPGAQAAAPLAGWGTVMTAGGATVAPAPEAAQAVAAPLSAAPAAGWQLALAAGVAPSMGAAAEAASGDDVPAAAGPAPSLASEGEEYARSLLHVLRAEDGVHAWLRDASLSADQVLRVASAMAGELALAGTPLSALTVNGRRILSSGAPDDQPGRRAAGHPDAAPVAPSTPFAFKGA
jgi:hypothetical protein